MKKLLPQSFSATARSAGIVSLLVITLLTSLWPSAAFAAVQIGTPRKLTLEAGASDGGSKPGGTVKHRFDFSLTDTTDQLGSIKFQYCTTAAPVPGGLGCAAPAGINLTGVTLNAQGGNAQGFTSTTVQNDDDASDGVKNEVVIGRSSASAITAGADNYEFASVHNPTAANTTFFVRVSTYTSLNGTGSALESGTVTGSTASPIVLSGVMPESLIFCTGHTISAQGTGSVTNHTDGSLPDCTTATSGAVSFDILFDPNDTATATSQMAASTNAGNGYAITVNGATLTSGANTIAGMGALATPTHGTPQFGMNLVQNVSTKDHTTNCTGAPCPLGNAIDDTSDTNLLRGAPQPNYATADKFTYIDGDTIAKSDNGSPNTGHPTNAQIFTSSYIVNVPGSQPAGTYTATLTYICTATY